jgi:hypothetical protein
MDTLACLGASVSTNSTIKGSMVYYYGYIYFTHIYETRFMEWHLYGSILYFLSWKDVAKIVP